MANPPSRDGHGFLLGLLVFGVIALVTAVRTTPPEPLPETAPAHEFSAVRAQRTLQEILGDQKPHPNGTPEAKAVRERIADRLRQLHLEVVEQVAPSCVTDDEEAKIPCPTVHNLMTRIEGTTPGKAVLVMVHSDSTPKGPGAADDGSGVAIVLEIAKALAGEARSRNPVILLITDGEEKNLLGARAFARSHPWMADVGVVVNLEARGTSGASRMFETSGPNGWLVRALSTSLRQPVTGSLFPAIYERMPNDTDLTIFKRRGLPGMNFAFIGSAQNYHTPNDDLAHLSLSSLQHQGENALGIVRTLAATDLNHVPDDRVVFFDVFGRWIVRWPLPWTLPMAVAALVGLVLAAVTRMRRGAFSFSQLSWSISAFLLSLVGALFVGLLGVMLLRKLGVAPKPWIDSPGPFLATFAGLGLLAAVFAPRFFERRIRAESLWIGGWLVWGVVAVIVAKQLPGGSYLFIVPALIAALAGVLATRWSRLPVIVSGAVAAFMWAPLILAWYEALGLPVLFGLSLFVALIISTLSPLLVRER